MPKQIADEFTNQPGLTRQQRYQLRHAAAGLCRLCDEPVALDEEGRKLTTCQRHRVEAVRRQQRGKLVGHELI